MDFDVVLSSGRVRARRWGEPGAPLLLCVHGLSANLSAFDYLAGHLSAELPDRQVVAFDLRGCGRSEVTPPGTYGLDAHVADVLELASALGAQTFDLAGWSLGALISMAVALRAGDRVRSIALIDHAGPSQASALEPIRAGLARLDLHAETPEEYLDHMRAAGVIDRWSPVWDTFYTYDLEAAPGGGWWPRTSRAAADEDFHQRWPRDWSEHWRALTMPAVLVRATAAEHDLRVVPDRAVRALYEVNPGVRVIETPAGNHFTCMTDPVTAAALRSVL